MTRKIALHCMKAASELERELCEECPIYGQTGCDHCFEDALQYVIGMLEQEPRWIPVTERLPEEKTAVLLSCDDMYLAKLNPCIGWISGNNFHTFSAKGSYLVKYPIAWMPLPEPYEGGQEDDKA